MAELPTRGAFAECTHTTFRIDAGSGGWVELELTEVAGLGRNPRADGRPFSLLFRGPAGFVLPQRTYPVEHERLGSMALFLVPLGPDATGMRYEAVFN